MKLSETLQLIFERAEQQLTIGELLERADSKSFGLLFIVFSLPIAMPFTPPFVAFPFGLAMMILAFQMLRGRHTPWLPEFLRKRRVAHPRFAKLLGAMPKWVAKFEKIMRPRYGHVYDNPFYQRAMGGILLVTAGIMTLPIPALNSLAAMAIFLVGLAMMERDGKWGLAGMVSCVAASLFLVSLFTWAVMAGVNPQTVGEVMPWTR